MFMEFELVDRIKMMTDENVFKCISCGRCTAICPAAIFMDYKPHQIIHLVRLNDERALESEAIWYCTSCLYCSERCPRDIDVARVMEALRAINLRKRKDVVALRNIKDLKKLPPLPLVASGRKYTG